MILYHPMNKDNEANKIAIEKYKDRKVYVFCKKNGLWLKLDSMWGHISRRHPISFKEALKKTKFFKEDSGIEYHFVDEIGDEKPKISDYTVEEAVNCATVKYENYSGRTVSSSNKHG